MSLRRAAVRLVPQCAKYMASEASIPALVSALSVRSSQSLPSSSHQIIRGFRSTSFAANSLVDILRNEIDYEKQNYAQPEELATGPPPPFTLTETRGDTLMTLSRQFGSETINVDVMVNDQPEEEPFESEEGVLDVDVGVVFTAEVVKGDQSFVFECKSDGSYLSILHVAIEPANEDVEDSAYTGPVYDELDEEVQRQFQVFLEERGVNAELGGYLLRLVHDKEQREYMDWLEKAAALVKA